MPGDPGIALTFEIVIVVLAIALGSAGLVLGLVAFFRDSGDLIRSIREAIERSRGRP